MGDFVQFRTACKCSKAPGNKVACLLYIYRNMCNMKEILSWESFSLLFNTVLVQVLMTCLIHSAML